MQVPTSPKDSEKYLYLKSNKTALYAGGLASFLLLFSGMLLFVIQHPVLIVYGAFILLLFIYLMISYFIGLFSRPFDFLAHQRILTTFASYRPTVDVYLPSCGEPIEIIANTFEHVSKLDWPAHCLNVYVLDDKGSANVEDLAKSYGYNYISRPNKGELKKAGNIRYAFPLTKGEFILILDADFCPRPDMLNEMIPYFGWREEIAIVQSPQYFEIQAEDSWMQKGASFVQELFYRLIQVSRQTWNASVCVGTCAVYRRSALEPHGGTAAIAYSEDLHTGFQAVCDGHEVRYIPINLSKGVCPDTVAAYVSQQYRWCTGSFSLFLNSHFWTANVPFMTKLCYLSGMLYYISTGLGLVFVPLPGIIAVWFFPQYVFWYNIIFSLPSFLYGTISIALWSRAKWGVYSMQARHISFWSHLLAIVDRVRHKTMSWVPTGVSNIRSKGAGKTYVRFKDWIFYWSFIVFLLNFSGVFYRISEYPAVHFLPNLFFCCMNFYLNMLILKSIDD